MNRIYELRMEMGISMREAAKRLSMPYTTYVNYEKGLREPSSEVLITFSRFFGVTIDYLVGNVNEPYFYLDNERILRETNSYGGEKAPTSKDGHAFDAKSDKNLIRIAGRDGSFRERFLTDDQMKALNAFIDLLPEVPDDL